MSALGTRCGAKDAKQATNEGAGFVAHVRRFTQRKNVQVDFHDQIGFPWTQVL